MACAPARPSTIIPVALTIAGRVPPRSAPHAAAMAEGRSPGPSLLQAPQRVLSTLNQDGSRRWLTPKLSPGRFLLLRRIIGWALIVLFTALPHVRFRGKPPVLLDIPAREFTLFGTTFLPTDTLLLALLLVSVFVTVFLITALFGRIWCGWGCPQTVYMEFVYRPLERLIEGPYHHSAARGPLPVVRRIVKYAAFLLVSAFLAHTFLAYFVGTDALRVWITRSPFEHPAAFLVMAAVTGLMLLDFGLLREQVCTLMCPYGRMQSVMLDRKSLIITYDPIRGEPRGRRGGKAPHGTPNGDCIDCRKCVTTCPTGIDIREGLQMECIGCAQCIDACDDVMDKIGAPRGLIRYGSQESVQTGRFRWMRPRVIIYPAILLAVLTLAGYILATRTALDVTFLRGRQAPYHLLEDGRIATRAELALMNRGTQAGTWKVDVLEGWATSGTDAPVTLQPRERLPILIHLVIPRDAFERGRTSIRVQFTDETGRTQTVTHHVPGPFAAPPGSPSGVRP